MNKTEESTHFRIEFTKVFDCSVREHTINFLNRVLKTEWVLTENGKANWEVSLTECLELQ